MERDPSIIALAKHLDVLLAEKTGEEEKGTYEERITELLAGSDRAGVWDVLSEDLSVYIEAESKSDVDAFFKILITALLDTCETSSKTLDAFLDRITSSAENSGVRRHVLSSVIESLIARKFKKEMLMRTLIKTVDYCSSSGDSSFALPLIGEHDMYIGSWDLPVSIVRMYELAVYKLYSNSGDITSSYTHLLKYLLSFNSEEDEELLRKQSEYAMAILRMVLVNYGLYENDFLMDLKVLNYLEKTRETELLLKICKILCEGTVSDFTKLVEEEADIRKIEDLDIERMTARMSLLTLLSMACEKNTLTFDEVSKELNIPEEEVEKHVIRGAALHLFSCKIDQVDKIVNFYKVNPRIFDRRQFEELRVKMEKLKGRIDSVLEVLNE